jgi:hypothetical protein
MRPHDPEAAPSPGEGWDKPWTRPQEQRTRSLSVQSWILSLKFDPFCYGRYYAACLEWLDQAREGLKRVFWVHHGIFVAKTGT